MSMHSTAADDAAYLLAHIPRHPDELASTDVWEHPCEDCSTVIQGGLVALAAHFSIVHADIAEARKARRREEARERARQRARERYRERRATLAAKAPQIPTQRIQPDWPGIQPTGHEITVGEPKPSPVQEALFDLDTPEPT